jgi:hypothetical protein
VDPLGTRRERPSTPLLAAFAGCDEPRGRTGHNEVTGFSTWLIKAWARLAHSNANSLPHALVVKLAQVPLGLMGTANGCGSVLALSVLLLKLSETRCSAVWMDL